MTCCIHARGLAATTCYVMNPDAGAEPPPTFLDPGKVILTDFGRTRRARPALARLAGRPGRPEPGPGPGGPQRGDPPLAEYFIKRVASHHNSKMTYGHAKCTNHANERSDSCISGRTTNRSFRWCKRIRIRHRLAEMSEVPCPRKTGLLHGKQG